MYEIDEVTEFVDGGRKQLKISPRLNPVGVYGGTWKLLLDKGMVQLTGALANGEVSGRDMGLFLLLVREMGFRNSMPLSQKEMGELVAMTQANVSRSWRKLKKAGLVRKGMVNPEIVTKGRTEEYAATLAAWHKLGGDLQPRVFGTPLKETMR